MLLCRFYFLVSLYSTFQVFFRGGVQNENDLHLTERKRDWEKTVFHFGKWKSINMKKRRDKIVWKIRCDDEKHHDDDNDDDEIHLDSRMQMI